MTESCCCTLYLAIHLLPIPLDIVQQYLHSEPTEEFYKKHYEQFSFCICFNTKHNAIREISADYPCLLVSETTPLVAAIRMNNKNITLILNIALFDNGHIYIDLDKQITPISQVVVHNYTTFYKSLMLYFGTNKDALLAKTVERCKCPPDVEQFDCFWQRIHDRLLAWNSDVDFYSQIHR